MYIKIWTGHTKEGDKRTHSLVMKILSQSEGEGGRVSPPHRRVETVPRLVKDMFSDVGGIV